MDNPHVTSKAAPAPGRARGGMSCARVIAGAVMIVAALAACSSTRQASAQTLLNSAKSTLDATSAAHFVLSSSNATTSGGTTITGGEGDVQRPDKLKGSLDIVVNGFKAQFKVIAVGGITYAELPFSSKYSKINTSSFGLGNPGEFLSPQSGLSSLLSAATGAKMTGQQRINGELVDEVSATVPGSSIPVLPDANPSESVTMVAAINPDNHQLRQVTLTGPFVKANSQSTFTLMLTSYGESVQITLPAAS